MLRFGPKTTEQCRGIFRTHLNNCNENFLGKYLTVFAKEIQRRFFGPYFPAFGLNMEIYRVNIRIQSKYGKIRTKKSPNTDTFQAGKLFVLSVLFACQE